MVEGTVWVFTKEEAVRRGMGLFLQYDGMPFCLWRMTEPLQHEISGSLARCGVA